MASLGCGRLIRAILFMRRTRTGLLVVTQLQPIAVIFTLPEDQLPEVLKLTRGGSSWRWRRMTGRRTTHLASGSLLTVDNQIDTTTGTVKAKAVFDNKDGALFPNQFVNVRLDSAGEAECDGDSGGGAADGVAGELCVSAEAGTAAGESGGERRETRSRPLPELGRRTRRTTTCEAQPVNVELTEGTQVILNGGVKPGDQIVVDGQEKLKNGSKVFPRQASPWRRIDRSWNGECEAQLSNRMARSARPDQRRVSQRRAAGVRP